MTKSFISLNDTDDVQIKMFLLFANNIAITTVHIHMQAKRAKILAAVYAFTMRQRTTAVMKKNVSPPIIIRSYD